MAFITNMGSGEWMVILILGLLIFGRRLPEVARSLGKSVNEFKKGMREFQESAQEVASDVNKAANDAVGDIETHEGQSTYDDPAQSYDGQTTGESYSESGETQVSNEPASDTTDSSPSPEYDPYQSAAATDAPQADSPAAEPLPNNAEAPETKRPDAAAPYEPMS
jgi:sec-independent protein translocase protein TatA